MKKQANKKETFFGFYEDEESIKMMDLINKSAKEQREKDLKELEEYKKNDFIFKVIAMGLLVSLLVITLIINSRLQKSGIESCIKKGNTESFCIAHS